MTYLRIVQILVFVITIYIANVKSQSNDGQQANSSNTQGIAKVNTGNPEAKALNSVQPNKTNNINQGKVRRRPQPRGRKAKRRPRKRRPPPRNGQRNGQKNRNGGKIIRPGASVKPNQIETEKVILEPAITPVKEVVKVSAVKTLIKTQPAAVAAVTEKERAAVVKKQRPVVVESQPAAAAKTRPAAVVETRPAAVVETRPAAVVEKIPAAASFADDSGFGLDLFFFGQTTTVATDPNEPPPDFSVKKIPKKKVIPKVDVEKSKAYDGTPCNETFKGHATDRTKYMMKYAEGVWETLDCPPNRGSGLVWRQDLCSCGEELVAMDPDDWCAQMHFYRHKTNRHKYMRKHHGVNAVKDCPASLVWSQEKCLCIYDPTVKDRPIENQVTFVCKTILQMTFEGSLKNTAEGYHVQPVNLRRRGKLPRIRYRKVPGSTEKAAMIVSQPLEFLAFRGNDFQGQVTYSLNFKISPRHEQRNTFMVLITDECIAGGQNKNRNASIRLAFKPNTLTFHLHFRTEKAEVDHMINGAEPDTYGWYKVVVYFGDNTLNMEVNGQRVFSQSDVLGKIPQNKCPLYIAGRGRGFDRSQDFVGYLDNVNLVKDCKFHEANIKFL